MRLQVSFILSAFLFGHMLKKEKTSKHKTNTSILEIYLLEGNSHEWRRTSEENSSYYVPWISTVEKERK